MGQKLVIGPMDRGLRNDRTAFTIDNESFPTLINAYQWRGRIKRKRGTAFLGRLQRFLGTTNGSGNLTVTIVPQPILSGQVSFTIGTDVFVDPGGASPITLLTNSTGSATLNRTTGVLTITGSQISTQVIYFPTLPVMGLEDVTLGINQFPATLGFDTTYSYNIPVMFPYTPYDVSFYKNLPSATYPNYTAKGTWTPTYWNGQNYQQFWTTNFQGALWATNGITVPFTSTNIGMQFKAITGITINTAGNGTSIPAVATLTILAHGLVQGDFVFINEVKGVTGINYQTGYVTTVVDANHVQVTFSNATLAGAYTSGGISQYLTSNAASPSKDCLRWYDGDPTNGTPPTPSSGLGWVNFAPPLSQANFSIDDEVAAVYYLVGARMILPFKDRLLFFGPVIQTSSGTPIYLQDTVIYSQDGTPYYTCSYTNSPSSSTDTPTNPPLTPPGFVPILVPTNQTATPSAYFEDSTGFGGFVSAGIDQPMVTVSPNEDVLICGFDRLQTRLIYSGNDIIPFNFFLINSELGSSSTFSIINMDEGVITRGNHGFIITSQTDCKRIDLEIPDQVFEFVLNNNGTERVTSQRDFINEWIYFTYVTNDDMGTEVFPDQTLQFNYRDNSWAIFNESYTTYGQFRPASGLTWNTLEPTITWDTWDDPWQAGSSTLFQSEVIGGNQQGFVLFRANQGAETSEATSLYIQNISGSTVTSANHGLNVNDYILISGVLGALGTQVNGLIFQVQTVTVNTFVLNPSIIGGTYQGGGLIQRMYVPLIQTKQFPTAWELARKTRLGVQMYMLTNTGVNNSQITLQIFLSQNSESPYIQPPDLNDGTIYSTILYTCPESTNIGLTPVNNNLQMVTAAQQDQIWHRINTSLLGDTVQLGFTLSNSQMTTLDANGNTISQFAEIELHRIILDINPSQLLA
jgi:hypothetical protein